MKKETESLLLAFIVLVLVLANALDKFAAQSDLAGFISGVVIGLAIVASGVYVVSLASKHSAAKQL